MNCINQVQISGSTTNGSTIVYAAPLNIQSDSDNEDNINNKQKDMSQEYPPNYDIDDDKTDEIRNLEAKNEKLMRDFKELHAKYALLADKYNKVTKKLARERANLIGKCPPVILELYENISGLGHRTLI